MRKFIENLLISLLAVEESEENLCSICNSYESMQKENLELKKFYEETIIELEMERGKNADLVKENLWYSESNKNLRRAKREAEKALWITESYVIVLATLVILKTVLEFSL